MDTIIYCKLYILYCKNANTVQNISYHKFGNQKKNNYKTTAILNIWIWANSNMNFNSS